jgi:hypothetical protein
MPNTALANRLVWQCKRCQKFQTIGAGEDVRRAAEAADLSDRFANDTMLRDMQQAADQIKARGGRVSERAVAECANYSRDSKSFKERWPLLRK